MNSLVVRSVLCAAAVLIGCHQVTAANLLVNGGFETTPVDTAGPLPTGYGDWQFNAGLSTGATSGIVPIEGVSMLQFIYTTPSAPSSISNACDIYQIVDISAYISGVRAGLAVATLSGWFNRIAGDAETDSAFGIDIRAYAGDPSTFPSQVTVSELAIVKGYLTSDSDPGTWERAITGMFLPAATDFLAVRIVSVENVMNDGEEPEFDGHYGDDIVLTMEIVPEPTSLVLLALGLGVILRKAKARR